MPKIYCGTKPLQPGQRYGSAFECLRRSQVRRYGKIKFDYDEVKRKEAIRDTIAHKRRQKTAAQKRAKKMKKESLKRGQQELGIFTAGYIDSNKDAANVLSKYNKTISDRKAFADKTTRATLKQIREASVEKPKPAIDYSISDAAASVLANELLKVKDVEHIVTKPRLELTATNVQTHGWPLVLEWGNYIQHRLSKYKNQGAFLYAAKRGLAALFTYIRNNIIKSFPPASSKFWTLRKEGDYIQNIVEEYIPKTL